MYEEIFGEQDFSLNRVRTFLLVARAGSMAKAVETEKIPQAQCSRQICELESWAGVPLFKKFGRTKVLTAEGQELQRRLSELLKALCEFRRQAKGVPRSLAIGAGASLLDWLVLPRLNRDGMTRYRLYNQRSSTICEWLNDGRLDFGIISKEYVQAGFATQPLGILDYALFVPKQLVPKGSKGDIGWVLTNVPLAVLEETSTLGRHMMNALSKIGTNIRVAVTCQSTPSVAVPVRLRQCAAVLPKSVMPHEFANGLKKFDHPAFRELSREVVIAWTKSAAASRPQLESTADELFKALRF